MEWKEREALSFESLSPFSYATPSPIRQPLRRPFRQPSHAKLQPATLDVPTYNTLLCSNLLYSNSNPQYSHFPHRCTPVHPQEPHGRAEGEEGPACRGCPVIYIHHPPLSSRALPSYSFLSYLLFLPAYFPALLLICHSVCSLLHPFDVMVFAALYQYSIR